MMCTSNISRISVPNPNSRTRVLDLPANNLDNVRALFACSPRTNQLLYPGTFSRNPSPTRRSTVVNENLLLASRCSQANNHTPKGTIRPCCTADRLTGQAVNRWPSAGTSSGARNLLAINGLDPLQCRPHPTLTSPLPRPYRTHNTPK
jgi:hypothetical protein